MPAGGRPTVRSRRLGTALKQYRDLSRKDPGFVSAEVFEQSGRPAHFVVLEKWADQKAFDAHGMAEHTKQMLSKMDSFRLGSYDQRPYRTVRSATPTPCGKWCFVPETVSRAQDRLR